MDPNSEIYEVAQPEPSALVESLRAFGYSLRTALADLIDNSITANSKNVWLRFEWDGSHSYILVKDDGDGMDESDLVNAMRPGSKSPLEEREVKDLGRFGLGLKTASFSQCRRLSVVSSKSGQQSARCWDLDYINSSHEWRLIKKIDPYPLEFTNESISNNGTLVLWEKLDRVIDMSCTRDNKAAYDRFLESIDEVKQHLGMVFHRFIEKPNGLNIWINDRKIDAWDPFLKNERATQELAPEKLFCGSKSLSVIPYVLPHQSKITKETHKKASGPKGWNAQQGFYVYRNERLLVAGDWLGLGFQKEEHYKLSRIQVDLPNSMDSEWQIDVKKSRAKPPGYLRDDFKRLAKITRERAVQIYRHRGKVTARKASRENVFLWKQMTRHGKYFYEINRQHPLVEEAFKNCEEVILEQMLRMLEETLPSAHIMISSSEEPEKMGSPFEGCKYESVLPTLERLYSSFLQSGCSHEESIERLSSVEPCMHMPEFVEIFKEEKAES